MPRILIVEDDRLVLVGLAKGLETRGYAVTTAATGEDAVAQTEAATPDLILVDICLPGISGIEAVRKIREKRDVPIIFLSALDTEQTVREAIDAGSITYLVKPIGIQQLVPAIENALARGRDIARLKGNKEHLATALGQSREISVAIGILMERHGLNADDAFEILRAEARSTRRKAADIAKEVIAGAPEPELHARALEKKR